MDYQEAIEVLHYTTLSGGHPKDLCDMKEVATLAMKEIEKYKQLGTLEEIREAMERQQATQVVQVSEETFECKNCGNELPGPLTEYCPFCGQKQNWSENP